MLRHLGFIWKNALRNRRRSALTAASIAASLCLLAVLMALYHSFFLAAATPESARRLIVRHRVSVMNKLPLSYLDRIRRVEGVQDAMVFQWFGGIYKDARDIRNFFGRFAVDPQRLFAMYPDYGVAPEQQAAFLADRRGCILGRPLMERFGFRIGDRLTLVGDQFPVVLELTIRGVYDKPRDNENLFFHYDYLREGLPLPDRDLVSTFGVVVREDADVLRVAQQIDALFEFFPNQTLTETERAFEINFLAYLGNVKAFLLVLSVALTSTLILVAGNTMAMSVRERAREVGILKTLGYAPAQIVVLILGEAVSIAVAGGLGGLLLAAAICAFLRQTPILFVDLKQIGLPPAIIATTLLAAAFIGACGSLPPAVGAARRTIMDAMRVND